MAPTRRRSHSASPTALPQVRRCLIPLRLSRRLPFRQPPPTRSSPMAPTRRRNRSFSNPAASPPRLPPDGSIPSPRMKVRAIGGDGGGGISLPRESSSLERDWAGSAETLDPSKVHMDAPDVEGVPSGRYASLRSILLEVLKDEGENVMVGKVKLLVMVVHAVFLDNGFVNFGPLQLGWAASIGTDVLTLRYTLPSLLHLNSNSVVDLRIHVSEDSVCICGIVPGDDSSSISLILDASCHGVWRIVYDHATLDDGEEEEVLEVLKMIKDRLLLPLHIDVCDKAGLPSPPCFMRLPTDIQIEILKLLSWSDLAKMACVCSEMKELASDDELWKRIYGEVLGEVGMAGAGETRWKDKFGASVVKRDVAGRRAGFYGSSLSDGYRWPSETHYYEDEVTKPQLNLVYITQEGAKPQISDLVYRTQKGAKPKFSDLVYRPYKNARPQLSDLMWWWSNGFCS